MAPLVVVLGGGAAGFFGAIRAATLAPSARVLLLEATGTPLQKVRISGGGRCNVTHHQLDPAVLVTKYPRGAKELRGVLSRFGPRETMDWFRARGVALKTEEDGRVFPVSDDSETICQCLLDEARKVGVEVRTNETVAAATREGERLRLRLKGGDELVVDALLLATGSNPKGWDLARALGHQIVPPVPSLFSFNVQDARLDGLAGVAVERVRAKLVLPDGAQVAPQEGPLLVTHWGLSAPAILRLSAWGARELHATGYRARLVVDLLPDIKEDDLRGRLEGMRRDKPRGSLGAHGVAPEVPRRLWERLVVAAGGDPDARWADVPNRGVQALLDQLKRATFEVTGKGPFKEEFVTAGGVARSEVDWRTMQSKLAPGLFLAGEVLDVDALTGGFNLQNAWSTGWIAGEGIAARVTRRDA